MSTCTTGLKVSNPIEAHLLTYDYFPKRPAQMVMGSSCLPSQMELIEEAGAKVVTVKVELLAHTWW